jgi:hypothetical protein
MLVINNLLGGCSVIQLFSKRWILGVVTCVAAALLVTYPFWRDTGNFVVRGLVLDQDGRPVPDVVMTFEAYEQRMILPLPPYGLNYRSAKMASSRTDADGKFAVQSPRQKIELVGVRKSGYVLGPRLENKPGPHTPSRSLQWNAGYTSGVVHLDEVSRPTPQLIVRNIRRPLDRSGTPTYLDLQSGEWSPVSRGGAELKVVCDGNIVTVRTVEADAGVWVGNNEFRYAPSTDYAHGVAFQLREQNGHGFSPTEVLFYAKTGSPSRFSRVRLAVSRDWRELEVSVMLNPTGSRDLRGGPSFPEPEIPGARSARVELGLTPWWRQCNRRTMALRSADHYPPAEGIDRYDRERQDRYLAPAPLPPSLPTRGASGNERGWS